MKNEELASLPDIHGACHDTIAVPMPDTENLQTVRERKPVFKDRNIFPALNIIMAGTTQLLDNDIIFCGYGCQPANDRLGQC